MAYKTKLVSVGFEVEGEFSHDTKLWDIFKTRNGGIFVEDVSVKYCNHQTCRQRYHTMEYNSEVFSLNDTKAIVRTKVSIKKLFTELGTSISNEMLKIKRHPIYHYNETAGFHIHLGFFPVAPDVIFSVDFYEYFMRKYKQKYKKDYYKRYKNKYCVDYNDSDTIMNKPTKMNEVIINLKRQGRQTTDGLFIARCHTPNSACNKYRSINFSPSCNKHGTVEFRIFRASTPLQMYDKLVFTIDTINAFLQRDFVTNTQINIVSTRKKKMRERIIEQNTTLAPYPNSVVAMDSIVKGGNVITTTNVENMCDINKSWTSFCVNLSKNNNV